MGLLYLSVFNRNMLVTNPKELSPTAEKICAEHHQGVFRKDVTTMECADMAWIHVAQDRTYSWSLQAQ